MPTHCVIFHPILTLNVASAKSDAECTIQLHLIPQDATQGLFRMPVVTRNVWQQSLKSFQGDEGEMKSFAFWGVGLSLSFRENSCSSRAPLRFFSRNGRLYHERKKDSKRF
ncbi:hypothetical protein CEXT_422781 [Caerostris extrusa]|uniref:Uncharacterized protein n=1 Tax=Caerostris extrusa TaxID=172846 RepID=A0AAV4V6H1_CAEEX|nr:hypothetical protein CEXT_422781 [Caerostris extrusa]